MRKIAILFIFASSLSFGQEIKRATLSSSGFTTSVFLSDREYIVQSSVGQASVIGSFSNTKNQLRQGFIQPFISWSARSAMQNQLQLKVFPNPSTEVFNIEFEELQNYEITVFDLFGRVVKQVNERVVGVVQVSLQGCASRVYLLKVWSENGMYTSQIQKIQ